MAAALPKKKLRQPAREYPPELYEPIVAGPANRLLALSMSASELEKHEATRVQYIQASRRLKLLLLFEHYKITLGEGCWRTLAEALADDLLPGFTILDFPPRGRGKPKGSTKRDVFQLAYDIEALAFLERVTAGEACRRLSKRKASRWKGEKSKSLLESYRRYCRNLQTTPSARTKSFAVAIARALMSEDPAPKSSHIPKE